MVHWQAFSDVIELQPYMYSIQRLRKNATCCMLRMVMLPSPKARMAWLLRLELYSAAIDLDPATDSIFAHRCRAKLGKMLWEEALGDAKKVHICRFVIQADQGYNPSAQRLDSVSPPVLESRDHSLRYRCSTTKTTTGFYPGQKEYRAPKSRDGKYERRVGATRRVRSGWGYAAPLCHSF